MLTHLLDMVACQMDVERWLHGQSAEGTKDEFMRPKGLQLQLKVGVPDF